MANSRQPLEWTDDDFYALIHETDTTPLDDSGPKYGNVEPEGFEGMAFFTGLFLGLFINVAIAASVWVFSFLF